MGSLTEDGMIISRGSSSSNANDSVEASITFEGKFDEGFGIAVLLDIARAKGHAVLSGV